MRGHSAAIVLVLIGTFFLLNNLGLIEIGFFRLMWTWWPLLLIVLGVGLFFTPDKRK